MARIAIFGLGYVGCVSGACLAEAGHEVVGVELDADKVRMVNEGSSPIVEPGLATKLSRMVSEGRLRATGSCMEAVSETDIAFVCVGTPGNAHGRLQLDALRRVCEEIGQAIREKRRPYTVVIRSTILPGTMEDVVRPALLSGMGEDLIGNLGLAVNPEFMREGSALGDFAEPPFTLVGTDSSDTASLIESVYRSVNAPFVHTHLQTAEAVKYVCNAYHALKVCFANEVGDVCSALGADGPEVMRIVRMDGKLNISGAYLRPGFAFGGSCLPKDVKAWLYAAHHADVPVPLLDSILPSNEAQIRQAVDAVLATGEKRVSVVGLSFKPDTDDLRESPMVRVVEALIGKGCNVRILDSNVALARLMGANRKYITEEIPHISSLMCDTVDALLEHAGVLVTGMDCAEAREAVSRASNRQPIIDLTRTLASLNRREMEAA